MTRRIRFAARRGPGVPAAGATLALAFALWVIAAAPASADYCVCSTIAVQNNPTGVAVDPATNRVYVANQGSATVSVIDGGSGAVIDTIGGLSAGADELAVDPLHDRIYVGGIGEVVLVDGSTDTPTSEVIFGDSVAAVNPSTGDVAAAGGGGVDLFVWNGSDIKHTARVTLSGGQTNPTQLAFNPDTNTVYAAGGSTRTLTAINASTFVATTVPGVTADGVAVDSVTNTVYASNFTANSIAVINGATNSVTSTITHVGQGAGGAEIGPLAVDPGTDTIYAPNFLSKRRLGHQRQHELGGHGRSDRWPAVLGRRQSGDAYGVCR